MMTTKLERLGIGLILGPIAPFVGFLGLWCIAYLLLPEKWIAWGSIAGLLLGLLFDIAFLNNQIDAAVKWNVNFWGALYIFYSVCVFGFFMGVPIFNVALALPAGFVIGARLASQGATIPHVRTATRRTAIFTTATLFGICLASAYFALTDPYTSANLEGMFRLPFQLTQTMIVGIILVGGLMLLGLQWWLVALIVQKTYGYFMEAKQFQA